jgi:cytoskeletal protein CcmA (bactofilin family)
MKSHIVLRNATQRANRDNMNKDALDNPDCDDLGAQQQ